jgi:galactoside O-acetyltransferase
MPMLSRDHIEKMGFAAIGENVQISDRASFYNAAQITLGNHVRIDDFCVLAAGAGGIFIGDHVHIAVSSSIIGAGKIMLSDFAGLSARVSIVSSSDDYSGEALTNPTVPAQYRKVTQADVFIGKHVIIGTGSVVLPGVTIEEGVAVAALSLVWKDCKAFGLYAGNPARRMQERSRALLDLEKKLLSEK